VITHGHADHARAGHGDVLATEATLAIMAVRYGEGFAGTRTAVGYGEVTVHDGVSISLVPAGHVLGSAQVVLRWKGLTVTVSGDYKRRPDPTCVGFEPVPSDVYVTEATFGLPVFRHPPAEQEVARLLASVAQFPDRAHLVGAYSLGKAQRVIRLLRDAGHTQTIHVHGALVALNALYERFGVKLGDLAPTVADGPRRGAGAALAGQIIVAPPAALGSPWAERFADPVRAFASGWMRVRARARQNGVELPLIISDHADWDELTETLAEIRPGEIWITHGRDDALARWSELKGIPARPLALVGYGDDDADDG
jgi:putative mRNA 3-end processing factor